MNTVYIVMTEGRKIQRVFRDKNSATILVNMIALTKYGMDINHISCPPLDFSGALTMYGWADTVWWTREVLY
jgi:hypothetical protein